MNRDFLKQLGLQKENDGTSTGQKSSNSGNYIKSYSSINVRKFLNIISSFIVKHSKKRLNKPNH